MIFLSRRSPNRGLEPIPYPAIFFGFETKRVKAVQEREKDIVATQDLLASIFRNFESRP
jgi:hypothetical protein